MLFQLGLEALEQGECVGRAAGEAGQDLVVIQAADFARGLLDHDVAQRDLTVAAQRDGGAAPNGKDGGAVVGVHTRVLDDRSGEDAAAPPGFNQRRDQAPAALTRGAAPA